MPQGLTQLPEVGGDLSGPAGRKDHQTELGVSLVEETLDLGVDQGFVAAHGHSSLNSETTKEGRLRPPRYQCGYSNRTGAGWLPAVSDDHVDHYGDRAPQIFIGYKPVAEIGGLNPFPAGLREPFLCPVGAVTTG